MIAFRHCGSAKYRRRAMRQRGSFLLEALISVLIVALGMLGLIGLQARAFQNVYRVQGVGGSAASGRQHSRERAGRDDHAARTHANQLQRLYPRAMAGAWRTGVVAPACL